MLGAIRGIHAYDDISCVMTAEAYETLLDFEKLNKQKRTQKKHTIYLYGQLEFQLF